LEETSLVSEELGAACEALGIDPLVTVLDGGEDYAVVAAFAEDVAVEGFGRIGRCEAGEPGIFVEREGGALEPVDVKGWDHFG
jgi:thiamine-monophosphate kinase